MDRRQRVVVSGLGAVTALGSAPEPLWTNLTEGRSAVRRIERFDASVFPTQIAAEIGDFHFPEGCDVPEQWSGLALCSQFGVVAACRAIEDSGILRSIVDRSRVGVAIAAGRGSFRHAELFKPCAAARIGTGAEFDWRAFLSQLQASLQPGALERRTAGTVPAMIAHRYGFRGPVMSVMTACAAGSQALADATRWIRSGVADVVLCGGFDSELFPMGLASFCLLKALSVQNDRPQFASRPFDADRDGFVIGEGAAMLVLEGRDRAIRRGATIYAEVVGIGSSSDAFRVTDPHPEGLGASLAMRRALADARLDPSEVGYINAHGTSTPANDRIESLAIKTVFGEAAKNVAVSSTKSMVGHLTIAAGAIEAVVTALTLSKQTIHPTINYHNPDPECDLDYVPNRARPANLRYALSNSFGFGGQCASLALKAHQQ